MTELTIIDVVRLLFPGGRYAEPARAANTNGAQVDAVHATLECHAASSAEAEGCEVNSAAYRMGM